MDEKTAKRPDNIQDAQRPSKRARMSVEPSNRDTTIAEDSSNPINGLDNLEEDEVYEPEEIRPSDLYLDTVSAFDMIVMFRRIDYALD